MYYDININVYFYFPKYIEIERKIEQTSEINEKPEN